MTVPLTKTEASWAPYRPGGILALDLARVVGFAYGHTGANRPEVGTIDLPQIGGEGRRYSAWVNESAAIAKILQPTQIIMAAPLPLPAMNNRMSAFQQITLRGITRVFAYRCGCAVVEIDEREARTDVLGRSRWPGKDGAKKAVWQWAKRMDLEAPDHNAADAAVLWMWLDRRLRAGDAPGHTEIGFK